LKIGNNRNSVILPRTVYEHDIDTRDNNNSRRNNESSSANNSWSTNNVNNNNWSGNTVPAEAPSLAHFHSIPICDWSYEDVGEWLIHIGMSHCKRHFGKITGKILLQLTEEKIQRLVGNYADCLVIQDRISEYKGQQDGTGGVTKEDLLIDHVTRGEMIAVGNFGSVFQGKWSDSTVAMKLLHDSAQQDEFFAEAAILK
jgi:hypothetical protein